VSSLLWCFQCAYGTYGAQWDTVAIERRQGPAQVLDYAALNGGPCRDRTYDQLIKRSRVPSEFFPLITNTYTTETVPQFADLRCDKALNS